MKEQFVPDELAVKLKELGFDEECFGVYVNGNFEPRYRSRNSKFNPNSKLDKRDLEYCTAPLWQQAFDWLLTKLPNYNLDQMEDTFDLRYYNNKKDWEYIVMMGTRQDCLEKLIELCQQN